MSFWEMLGLVSAMATILGVFLTIYAMINNRVLKAESRSTREILSRIEQGQNEARKDMAETFRKMDERQEQVRQEVVETRREVAEARREMAEAIKYVADLVRVEGERTRQAVRAPS